MAERRAVNKYYPPDWDPSKGSINTYNKSHPLRKRAKKIDQGILVVRFGMPFNIWCLGCNNHIGRGVRYNAEKRKIDPSKLDYVVKDGARRQLRMGDETQDEDIVSKSSIKMVEETRRRVTDPMSRLEMKTEDKMKGDALLPNLVDIKRWREKFEDSFSINQLVRARYRERRKRLETMKLHDKRLLERTSLKIPLVRHKSGDTDGAKQILTRLKSEKLQTNERNNKAALLNTRKFMTNGAQQINFICLEAGTSNRDLNLPKKTIKKESSF